MTADELRERLARLESDAYHGARLMDQHGMILSRHSHRIATAEQNIYQIGQRQAQTDGTLKKVKTLADQEQKDRQKRETLMEAAKWLGGGVVLLAVIIDAIPNSAAGILRAWLGLP